MLVDITSTLEEIDLASPVKVVIMFDTSDAAGWLIFIWMGVVVILCPIYFVINLIVDLIAFLIFKNKKEEFYNG